jgi:hypothetical protein
LIFFLKRLLRHYAVVDALAADFRHLAMPCSSSLTLVQRTGIAIHSLWCYCK